MAPGGFYVYATPSSSGKPFSGEGREPSGRESGSICGDIEARGDELQNVEMRMPGMIEGVSSF
jgi:hypothetical protein